VTTPWVKNWTVEDGKVSFYFVITELGHMGGIIIVGTINGIVSDKQLLEQSQMFEAEGVHGKAVEPITPDGGYIIASEANPLSEMHEEEAVMADPVANFESTDVPEGTTFH